MGCGSDGREGSGSVADAAGESASIVDAHEAEAGAEAEVQGSSNDAGDAGSGTAVVGVVVDFVTQRPLSGRTVSIRGHHTTTDGNGGFTLASIPPVYDVVVLEADGSTVSVFAGMTGRSPALVHHSSTLSSAPTISTATFSGSLSGGTYPLGVDDLAAVYFFSPQSTQHAYLGAGGAPGPAYGPLTVRWAGTEGIDGRVVGMVTLGGGDAGAGDGGLSAWFANQSTSLANRQAPVIDLALARVQLTHMSGVINVPATYQLTQFLQFDRLNLPDAVVDVVNKPMQAIGVVPFDETVPDLVSSGLTPCVAAASTSSGVLWTEQCGPDLGSQPLTVSLQPAPSLTMPPAGAMISENAAFVWSAFEGGVHGLALEPDFAQPTDPAFYLYTAGTSATWPDSTADGIPLPLAATYHCTIEGLGPYPTMDEAFGQGGLGAIAPREMRRSAAPPVDVTFSP